MPEVSGLLSGLSRNGNRCQWLLTCALLFSAHSSVADEEQELKALRAELEQLNQQLQQFQGQRSELETEKRRQELELSRLYRAIHNTDRDIGLAEEQLRLLHKDKEQLEIQRRAQELALRQELHNMYKTGQEEPVKMLLNQEDPKTFSRLVTYYRYLLQARTDKLESFTKTIAEIDQKQQSIDRKNLDLITFKGKLANQQDQLRLSMARRDDLQTRIQGRILSAEQQIQEKQEDAHQLELLIREAIERIARLAPPQSYRPFAELKGKYPWPTQGRIRHRFGQTRSGDLHWQGVIIGARTGAEVASMHHGRVVFADYMRGYGLLVIIDHEEGYMTLYGHNQSLFVEPGDWVAPGEQIAMVGNTGGLEENGLYFEVRQNGQPQNPSSWCRD